MSKVLTPAQKTNIKKAIYKKADDFGYASSGRHDSGRFMDELVNDPEVGGVLKEYMSKERIRTYIKDGVLNAYTKRLVKKVLATASPTDTIQQVYGVQSMIIQTCTGKDSGLSVSRAVDGRIIVVSGGTVLKWETALRKALELVARQQGLTVNGNAPKICLHLAVTSQNLTASDKTHITSSLTAVGVQAIFCDGDEQEEQEELLMVADERPPYNSDENSSSESE